MEKHEKPQPTPLDWLKESIQDTPKEIAKEFESSANTWIACYTSSVNVVETYLGLVRDRRMIPQDHYNLAPTWLERIKVELDDLFEAYPEKSDILPKKIRNRLIRQINILRPLEKDEKPELG